MFKGLPLWACAEGSAGTIAGVRVQGIIRNRLTALGFVPGIDVVVVRSGRVMIVDVGGTRVAIDEGVAGNILVCRVKENNGRIENGIRGRCKGIGDDTVDRSGQSDRDSSSGGCGNGNDGEQTARVQWETGD